MTRDFVPPPRRPPPAVAAADIVVEAPPDLPAPASQGPLLRLLPLVASLAAAGAMAASSLSGWGGGRAPVFLALPAMMLLSTVATVTAGRGRRGDIDAARAAYLEHLSSLRQSVAEIAAAQRFSERWRHPDPDTLWTMTGGPRMWERRPADADFCLVRVGVGARPLAARLVVGQPPPRGAADPVTTAAMRRFVETHAMVADVPIAIGLRAGATLTLEGDPAAVRGLLRAMICQLAVLHPPDRLLIAAAVGDRRRAHWEWLKWLPHNGHPAETDALGPARMVYPSVAGALAALGGLRGAARAVLIVELDERADAAPGVVVIAVGGGRDGAPVSIVQAGETDAVTRPDRLDPVEAMTCARRLAAYRVGADGRAVGSGWPALAGIGDIGGFDPMPLWSGASGRERLCVPLGCAADGTPLRLDIKEPADGGVGPHGLCVGATGSGKSELLRTVALGMMALNSPASLNLLLVDFKGGATFLDMARAPHVAAVITNLADDAPLVARMRDALAGEMNRRQELLRSAGCGSAAAYERARAGGAAHSALPSLFVIVDEFSELLGRHPDFADTFVAIGRVGRSLGMHLLLASQRLEEGRLRGLEAHLSYRLCLKTLSPGESRLVLGTSAAFELPNTPGAGYLRAGSGEPVRFQAAFVSGPVRTEPAPDVPAAAAATVRPFGTRAAGPVARVAASGGAPAPTVLHALVDRLSGHGPPAHRVWLPPLGPPPALATLLRAAPLHALTVPIGLVDRPLQQRRTPLLADLSGAAGNVAVVGAPQSGKSTALRTLITALAATHDPCEVQFYCLDFGGGALAALHDWPHVGAVAGRAEPRLAARVVAECESVVRSREAFFGEHRIDSIARYRRLRAQRAAPRGDPFGDVFLVIDGWGALRHELEELEAPITALAVQGLSFGVHVVLSAARWADVRPSLRDQIGTRIELRLGDPADSELDRKAAQHVPRDRPGRGLSPDGLHMVIAVPGDEIPHGDSSAPPIALLPSQVDHHAVVTGAGAVPRASVLIGIEEHRLQPVVVDFERHSHLLVLGDSECGKTAALRVLCRELARTASVAEAHLLIVDFRRALLGAVETGHVGGYAASPATLAALLPGLLDRLRRRMPPADATQEQLRAGSRWSGPDIYVLVDDYELVAAPSGNPLAGLVEYLPHARDLGLHLVLARRSGGAERALFEPLLAGLRDLGCAELRMSGCPGDGAPFGSGRPVRLPPGRGVLVARPGDEQLIQVAWSPP
ncbi:type VII secretion protein EccCb [Mycobacterium sp. HUMS_1102779]|uniref:type VII secretion protein EccCb n=1 Tax=Mycobacterium sp. HUMS_1102779 TaxID=3383487 RepID=UPI0038999779